MDEKTRAKLAAELDKDGRWFQKAVRHYHPREWATDMRRALGIGLDFLADETQVSRKTLYLAEQREKTGAITIAELEALAEAMECELVYAIVPEHGTVAELVEKRKENPRKTRAVREKEDREYKEWYAQEVEKIRARGRRSWTRETQGTGNEGTREQEGGDQGDEAGAEGQEAVMRPAHSSGVQRLMDEVGQYDVGRITLEKVKRDVEEWERKGRVRDQGAEKQGLGTRG
jgi:DNA-binding Xre family transcriptional regulator